MKNKWTNISQTWFNINGGIKSFDHLVLLQNRNAGKLNEVALYFFIAEENSVFKLKTFQHSHILQTQKH